MSNLDFWRGSMLGPARDLGQFQRAVDRLFDDWAGWRASSKAAPAADYPVNPSCEISENKGAYLLKFDLPGLSKDQIKIDLHENRLTVSGERKEERKGEDEGRRQHFSELYYGSFMRSFVFPQTVDPEKVEARYENGVLTLNVAKASGSTARQITVK